MAIKQILLAIDGTGSHTWRREDGLNSHIYRFYNDFSGAENRHKYYLHGPGNSGLDVGSILNEGIRKIYHMIGYAMRDGAASLDEVKVNIVGHSRGAFMALRVANILENPFLFLRVTQPGSADRVDLLTTTTGRALPIVSVNFLGLYDTVKRAATELSGEVTLRNVNRIAHAVRPRGRTRLSFSGIDIPQAATNVYDTSHGGIGGDPGFFGSLSIVSEDPYCNARHLVGDVDDVNFLNWAYGAAWGATSNTVEDIRRFWQNSQQSDQFIRAEAVRMNVHFGATSAHIPYKNDTLGNRLKNLVGL